MDGSLPILEERVAYIRSTHELADQIVELAGHLNAGNYRFLAMLAEFDRRKGWNCGATQDCAHWLNWKCGVRAITRVATPENERHFASLVVGRPNIRH